MEAQRFRIVDKFSAVGVNAILIMIVFFSCARAPAQTSHGFVDGVNVVISGGSFHVGDKWSDAVKIKLIGGTHVPGFMKAVGVMYDVPLTSWLLNVVTFRYKFRKMGAMIAEACKAREKGNVLMTVSCVSNSVNATLKQAGWPDYYSFCQAHASAFKAAFAALNLPGSTVDVTDASNDVQTHVVNKIVLTTRKGEYFGYVIDVGNAPDKFFPDTDATEDWHKENKLKFPEFTFDKPVYHYDPATGAASGSR